MLVESREEECWKMEPRRFMDMTRKNIQVGLRVRRERVKKSRWFGPVRGSDAARRMLEKGDARQ